MRELTRIPFNLRLMGEGLAVEAITPIKTNWTFSIVTGKNELSELITWVIRLRRFSRRQ